MRGETAEMCAIKRLSDQPYRVETEMVDVSKVANLEKKVPDEWIAEDGMHVNEHFERYARPLIQAELTPIYINGVPPPHPSGLIFVHSALHAAIFAR